MLCHVGQEINEPERLMLTNTSTESVFKSDGFKLTLNATYVMSLEREGNEYACGAQLIGGASKSIDGNQIISAPMPEVGLRIRSSAATFAWFLVVTSP